MKPINPPHLMQNGDRVKYAHPSYPRYVLTGTVIGSYEDDRLVVLTEGGREWALFMKYLVPVQEGEQ